MGLAFRLYGNFYWPPIASAQLPDDANQKTRIRGVVEIHYMASGGSKAQRALLRWFPHPSEPPAKLPETKDHIFDLTPEAASKWFKDRYDKDCAIWIGRSGKSKLPNQTWLVLQGGFLLEQYHSSDGPDGPQDILDLQWPLVESCQFYKDTTTFSVLRIYGNEKPLFRYDLCLPVPLPRTGLTGKWQNPPAFPFSAVYDPAPPSGEPASFLALVGGWIRQDALSAPGKIGQTSFLFTKKLPKNKRLGEFHFAKSGKHADFAISDDQPGVEPERYWPANNKTFLQELLRPYGFELNPINNTWLGVTDFGVADLSLRFPRDKDGVARRLVYRVSVRSGAKRDDQDIKVDTGGLRLRLADEIGGRETNDVHYGASSPDKVGGWLRTGRQLSADCELSWDIAKEAIWSDDRSSDWAPKVALWMHWLEEIPSGGIAPKRVVKDAAGKDYVFDLGLLAQANYSLRETRTALELGEAGLPHSFLPSLASLAKKTVRFILFGSPVAAKIDGNGLIGWGRFKNAAWRRPAMRLTLAGDEQVISGADEVDEKKNTIDLLADGQSFFAGQDTKLSLKLSRDPRWTPVSVSSVEDGELFFASFKLAVTATSQNWEGRLASLRFADKGRKTIAEDQEIPSGHLRIGGQGARNGTTRGLPALIYPGGRIAAETRFIIPATTVEQTGVSTARADRSGNPAPLLIPLSTTKAGKDDKPAYWLTVTETLAPRNDRLIKADIYDNAGDVGDRSYVVFSSEPFTIYHFTHKPLSDRGQADNASVAFYSGDDRVWQFKQASGTYHFTLPPQSVGESADKPGRLEIHDLPEAATLDSPPRPFASADARKRRAVEFRLTPSAEIWIRPSDVERGYFMPESMAHEIFRQYGAYGLGAALAYLRAEFLYGLPVGIDVSKERSIARGARVAEIEALVGRLTGAAREPDAEPTLASRWNILRNAIARRPGRLEIWARDLDSAIAFTPARFSDGVQFALRKTALHRAPVLDLTLPQAGEGAADHTSPPRIGGIAAVEAPTTALDFPRHHPQGLSGGALWPVESLNLFKIILQSPQSNGGMIEAIALSATGGDASQKAEFLGGKVAIISETHNGFVERQKVEVLGRICALWHRAKHVVVYERTVNPSAQFAPKFGGDPEGTRSRRPILRKVREYIELLEPERSYPDFATATPRSAGFLERVRFNSKIINVDSAWGSDVANDGWQVPLWNRLAARERPQVYPMPDVAFISIAEGEGEKPVVTQQCRDPDYLFFFADFLASTSDTNQWAPRLDLDYPNMWPARALAETVDEASAKGPEEDDSVPGNPDGRRRAVGRILPGLRRFTWRLSPAAQKTAINAGRAVKPVYAGLDSLTFMRATHPDAQAKQLPDELKTLLKLPAKFHESETLINRKYWGSKGESANFDGAQEFSTNINSLLGSLKKPYSYETFDKARTALAKQWDESDFKEKLKGVIPKDFKSSDFEGFTSKLTSGSKYCEKLKTDAIEMIQRKEMLVRAALQDWVAEADQFLTKDELFKDKDYTKAHLIEELKIRAAKVVRPVFAEVSADIGNVEEGVEKARAALIDFEAEIEALCERARARLRQVAAGYDDEKPWSNERRAALRAGLTASISNINDDIAAALDEARQRLAIELNGTSQAIAGHVAKALKVVSIAEADALAKVTHLQLAVDRLFARIDTNLTRLLTGLPNETLDGLIAKIDKASIPDGLKQKAKDTVTALKDACTAGKKTIADAAALAQKVDQQATEALGEVAGALRSLRTGIEAVVDPLDTSAKALIGQVKALTDAGALDVASAFAEIAGEIEDEVGEIADWLDHKLAAIGSATDVMVAAAIDFCDRFVVTTKKRIREIPATILPIIDDIKYGLQAVQNSLSPNELFDSIVTGKVGEALTHILAPLPNELDKDKIDEELRKIREYLDLLSAEIATLLRGLNEKALDGIADISEVCGKIFESIGTTEAYLKKLTGDVKAYFDKELGDAYGAIHDKIKDIKKVEEIAGQVDQLLAAAKAFDYSVRSLPNNLSRAYETGRMYRERVFDQIGKLGDGGGGALPNNILKLYSAVTSAPEIAALKADIDRIRANFDELNDIIETTKANALFNRLGDELKALGLSLPFDKIADRLLPADLTKLDIGKVFRNFGGAKLDRLLKGYKIPADVRDAIRVTHDFDKKQARAWVQVDINAPMRGRRSLFSVGLFKADFVDMALTGQVRLEASKDQNKVMETGFGRIGTTIDLTVSGQSMVRLEKFGLNFTRESGLDVEFDPKNIRLNPSFKFIQDFLSTLFPDDVGGLEIIKQNGIPVGLQHDFALPPVSLNFATSGVQNISIENHFKLVAFPDFLLANRFNLSTVERPFIFSIFIIGGTGYIQIDTEYRPFDRELMVVVEAGAGGSASLAFAFGPFSGQVYITLSGAITYRKVIGRPGGGLLISAILVIAGHVDVAGIVTVGIVLMLRMTYRDNGQIDAEGTLTVTIRISKFFKLKARASVKYKLRGGKSETAVTTSAKAEAESPLKEKIEKLQKAADKLKETRT